MYAQGAKAKMNSSHKTIDDALIAEIPAAARNIDADRDLGAEEVSSPKLPNAEEIQNMFNDPAVKGRLRTQLAAPLIQDLESLIQMAICQYLGKDPEFSLKISNLLVNWGNRALSHGTERSKVYATAPQYAEFDEEAKRTLALNYATAHAAIVGEIQNFYRACCLPTQEAPQSPIEGQTS